MDSRFLQSLIYVVECGSIAEAARRQHLTSAAISQRIKALEIEFGFELLHRNGNATTPSCACQKILPRIREVVAAVNTLKTDTKPKPAFHQFRLGVIPSQITAEFTSKIPRLATFAPHIHISLSHNISRNLYSALISGELDGVILEEPAFELPKNLQAFILRKEALVLISKLNLGNDINKIIETENYIEYLPDPFIHNIAQRFLLDQQIRAHSICDSSSLHAIEIMVRDGAGVSLVPHWTGLQSAEHACHVTHLPTQNYFRRIVLLTNQHSENTDVIDKLVNAFQSNMATPYFGNACAVV